jgi:hypothetical protein
MTMCGAVSSHCSPYILRPCELALSLALVLHYRGGMEQRNYDGTNGGNDGGASGWTTTEVAAEALGVSSRTVRNYIQRGYLAAKEEHEGITDRYLVSVDSLYALRDRRKNEARGKRNGRRVSEAAETQGNDTTELLRETIARLETRAEQNAELRTRLQLTAQAESTLREALDRERGRADRAERRLEELEARLAEPLEAPEPHETAADAPEGVDLQEHYGGLEEGAQRSWWRRWFGFE